MRTINVICAALLGCAALQPAVGAPPQTATAPSNPKSARQRTHTVGFEFSSNHMYVQASVNGSRPLWFIFDTGAELTVLDARVAREIGLETGESLTARGSGEKTAEGAFVHGATLRMGDAEVRNLDLVTIDLGDLTAIEGRRLDGIAGYDFLSAFVVEIEYAHQRIRLHDPAAFDPPRKRAAIPFTIVQNVPHVHASVTAADGSVLDGEFTVDTGSRSALTLNTPFVDANPPIRAMAESARPAPFGFGVGGETRTRVGRIPRFTLGGFALASVVTGFSRVTKGADSTGEIAGNIGGDLLRRFTVTIDYARQKMYLAPNEGFARPFEYDMFGALLLRDGDAFVMQRIVDGSPAARAGLAAGDAIVSVDGKPSSRLSFESIRQLFVSRPGRTVTLKIRKGDNVRDVVVQLERIV